MGIIEIDKSDVRKLLQNPELVEEIAKGVMEDPSALDDLAEDIADELSDVLEDDPDFRAKIIQSAMANEAFKNRLVKKLVAEFGD
ncbi:MAG: hypothetical protein V3R87_04025 [Dehalococcoidia bacterium]